MSIFVDEKTRVIVQGITGREGGAHARQMLADGTKIVAGVTPGRGGQKEAGIEVFDTVVNALAHHEADWSIGFVPAAHAKEAALEALRAGLNTIVITEHVPVLDALAIHDFAEEKKLIAIGPNCPGIISPKKTKLGIMPANIFKPGPVGVISRSGTLTYEIVDQLSRAGFGQTSAIGIGGDPINLTNLAEALEAFERDPDTKAIVLVGEIGGSAEESAARDLIGSTIKKPIVAYLAGRAAPPGKQLGHAGAIIRAGHGTIKSKQQALEKAGVPVASVPSQVPILMAKLLNKG